MIYPQVSRQASNAEVEKDETLVTPSGNFFEFDGQSHSEGGTPVLLKTGDKIYSKFLKLPAEVVQAIHGLDKKMSPADLSKKYNPTKYNKIVDDTTGRYDELAVKTAKLMSGKHQEKLDQIFQAQEAMKASREVKSGKYQLGGTKFKNPFEDETIGKLPDFNSKTMFEMPYTSGKQPDILSNMPNRQVGIGLENISDREAGTTGFTYKPFEKPPTVQSFKTSAFDSNVGQGTDKTKDKSKYTNSAGNDLYYGQQALNLTDLLGLKKTNPYYVFTPTQLAYNRFDPVDKRAAERAFNQAKMSIEASGLPEQVKQARIADMYSKMMESQSNTEVQNHQAEVQNENQNTARFFDVVNSDNAKQTEANYRYTQEQAKGDFMYADQRQAYLNNMTDMARDRFENRSNVELINQLAKNYKINPDTGKVEFVNGQVPVNTNILSQYGTQTKNFIETLMDKAKAGTLTDAEGKILAELIKSQK